MGLVVMGLVVMGKLVVLAAAYWAAADPVYQQRAPQPLGMGWADQGPMQPLVLVLVLRLRGDHLLG